MCSYRNKYPFSSIKPDIKLQKCKIMPLFPLFLSHSEKYSFQFKKFLLIGNKLFLYELINYFTFLL